MNEVKNAIEQLRNKNKFYESENDEYSRNCTVMNNIAIKALEEKLERDKGCEYCKEDKCRLCIMLCDYWYDGGSDKCSATGTDDPCDKFDRFNYCPNCGAKLEEEK